MREKVVWLRDPREVVYSRERLGLLRALRERAEELGRVLGAGWWVHGSLARGDVHRRSDIDIVCLEPPGELSYRVELALESHAARWVGREVVMATPNSAPKGRYILDETLSATFPLAPLTPREEGFYRFGGVLPVEGVSRAPRVAGVSKKLLLILPTEGGHIESSIIGREAEAARLLGIPADVVRERVRVLARRDRVGRTGVYLREPVPEGESFEGHLKRLADRDPVVRRNLRARAK
ncbi:MAG: nucleotidyltransferase domain-containing protein [Thermoplasmatota archaeon]